MAKIYLVKEENGNVVIRQTASGEIIASLHPAQNIQTSMDNSNGVIIKSYLANEGDKGLVINYNDIESFLCDPPIITINRNTVIESLKRDFFFDVSGSGSVVFVEYILLLPKHGKENTLYVCKNEKKVGYWHQQTEEYRWFEQLEYYYTYNDFPPNGILGNMYLDLSTFDIYFWFGDYYKFKSGLQNLENTIVSSTEVIRTFYFDMPFGFNNRIDLLFPFSDVSGITSLKLTSDESLGCIQKQFSFESNINLYQLNYYKTKNDSLISRDIFNELGIGDAIVKLDSDAGMKRITIPIVKRVERAINKLKLEVKFENPNPLNQYLQSFLNILSMSSNYVSATPIVPPNYETIGIQPSGSRSNKFFKQLVVDPNTGAIWQSNQNYCIIPITKKVTTNIADPINSKYIGIENEITDNLNVVDPNAGGMYSKSVFSNIVLSTYEKLKIVSGKIFSSDNNVRITFKYIVINLGTSTHYAGGSLIAQFDLTKGWNDLIFPDTLDFDAAPATFVIIEVQSLVQSTRNVIIHGGISCLN